MFEITQKQDKIVLDAISIILPMKVYKKNTYYTCINTSNKDIEYIIQFFNNTIKGIKSLEYRV